jgi:2-polyprenyl-6-methoxyphenol hydroxylase-like FAD-dependent oxidoreductase
MAQALGGRFVSLPRSELALAIYETVAHRCQTLFGDKITRIVRSNGQVGISFQSAPPQSFDLVVGADGLHSGVRAITWGDEGRGETYLGYKAAAFEVTGYAPRDELAYVAYGTPGKHIARFAMRDGKTLFFFIFLDRHPETPTESAAIKTLLRRTFAGNGWESDRILAAMDATDDIYLDRVSQIHLDSWSRDRVVLVGDAAACPSLLAGEGAALAMVGAYVLAGELRLKNSVALALAAYEARMRPLIAAKQKAAARFASSFAPRTRLGLTFRNIVTNAMHLPFVAQAILLPQLRDKITLPDYDVLARVAGRRTANAA